MPPIKFDWTVSVSNLLTVAFFVISMATAWFSLKEDVHLLSSKQTQTEIIIKEIKDSQRENKVELKQDLRDLRNDIQGMITLRPPVTPHTSSGRLAGSANP